MTDRSPNSDRLVSAIAEYFTDFAFHVRRIPSNDSATAGSAGRSKRRLGSNELVEVRFSRAQMIGDGLRPDLLLTMEVDPETNVAFVVPHRFLSPARDPETDSQFDLEHLIAEALVFEVEDTIRRFTLEELDGSTLSDLWS